MDTFGEDVDGARCATLGIAEIREGSWEGYKAKEQVEFSWECWRLDSHLSLSNPDHIFMLAFLTPHMSLYFVLFGQASTQLSLSLDDMAGSTAPIKNFDPLGLATSGSEETLL